ncbi:MAG: hypothetical protein HDS32_00125 [Bacteroides sp.]|nr:hypothetical protein [Bacteroides sp.]
MTNDSTTILSTSSNHKSAKSPSRATIEMLRQFARTCVVVNDMSFRVMMSN